MEEQRGHMLDIPADWYLRPAIWIARFLRRKQFLHKAVVATRDRTMLGAMMKLHLEAVHDIRNFAVNRDTLTDSGDTYGSLERLANSCRNVMADLLQARPEELHCTIKLCDGHENAPKREWQVYTIARSTPCSRPAHFGRSKAHLVGHNSSFAAVSGTEDRKYKWEPYVASCFLCNDLKGYQQYDCSRDNWQAYFRAAAVFPMRYRRAGDEEHTIIGYLTFDTLKSDLFYRAPCIFDYLKRMDEYEKELSFLSLYHVGGTLADTLTCAFLPLLSNTQTQERW